MYGVAAWPETWKITVAKTLEEGLEERLWEQQKVCSFLSAKGLVFQQKKLWDKLTIKTQTRSLFYKQQK